MARTAVIASTATAVSGNVSRRQQAKAQSAADQQAQYAPAPQESAQAAQPAAAADDSLSAQIERLATLKTAGVISDAEFSAAKAKLLGI